MRNKKKGKHKMENSLSKEDKKFDKNSSSIYKYTHVYF